MIIFIENETEKEISIKNTQIKKAIRQTLTFAGKESSKPYEVSVLFIDRKRIREMNRDYRFIDRATDVISFAYQEGEGAEFAEMMLGDIAICPEVVKKHSEIYSTEFELEMIFVVVHGTLHLLGYDHVNKKKREEMRELENLVMNKLFLNWRGRCEN